MYKEVLTDIKLVEIDVNRVEVSFIIENKCDAKPYKFSGIVIIENDQDSNGFKISSKSVELEGFTQYIKLLVSNRIIELVYNVSKKIESDLSLQSVEFNTNAVKFIYRSSVVSGISQFDSSIVISA